MDDRGKDYLEEFPDCCGICGMEMELVRPGKSQPRCSCYDDEEAPND